MIARVWTGRVPTEKADGYLDLMVRVAIPDYRRVPGNLNAWCLHRKEGDTMLVQMLTFWSDEKAIAAFAGKEIDRAKYYDFDAEFLIEMPANVEHYVVKGQP